MPVRLSKGEREVVEHIVEDDLTISELGKKLGKSGHALGIRLYRLKKKNEYNSNFKLFYELGRASVKAAQLTPIEVKNAGLVVIGDLYNLLTEKYANISK